MWAATLVCLSAQGAGGMTELIENGSFADGPSGWTSSAPLQLKTGGPGGRSFLEFSIPDTNPQPWSVVLSRGLTGGAPQGTELEVSFWGRSARGQKVSMMIEESASPYEKLILQEFTLSPQWTAHRYKVALPKAALPGQHQLAFHLAHQPGILQLADIKVTSPLSVPAQAPAQEKPLELLRSGGFGADWREAWGQGDGPALTAQVADSPPKGRVLRWKVQSGPSVVNPWDIQMGQAVQAPVRLGDQLHFQGSFRSPESQAVWVVFELGRAPHTKLLMRKLDLTPSWQEVKIPFKASIALEAKDSQFKLFAGGQNGTIEAAGLSLINYGRSAPARLASTIVDYRSSSDSSWKAAAQARIRKHRMGDIQLKLVDAKGKPLPSLRLQASQQTHLFRFGTAVTTNLINDPGPTGEQYRKRLKSVFNTVVMENDLKWPQMIGGDFAQTEKALNWLKSQGFAIRGHNLVWGSTNNLPEQVRGLSNDQMKGAIADRILDAARKTKDKVYVWDVVNEAVTERELWDGLGWDQFTHTFRLARQAMPGVKLAYNDFNITNEGGGTSHRRTAIERAKLIQQAGPYLDIFGDQAHMGAPATPISRVLKAWDEVYDALKVPMEVTEFDFVSWLEPDHGQYTEDYLTAAFSHPQMEGFIFWGFWEGAHWLGAQGGAMVNRDWTPRLAWKKLDELVNKTWKTQATLRANGRGAASLRGFYGRYQVQAVVKGKTVRGTFELKPGQKGPVTVTLR